MTRTQPPWRSLDRRPLHQIRDAPLGNCWTRSKTGCPDRPGSVTALPRLPAPATDRHRAARAGGVGLVPLLDRPPLRAAPGDRRRVEGDVPSHRGVERRHRAEEAFGVYALELPGELLEGVCLRL